MKHTSQRTEQRYRLGLMYLYGLGVASDYSQALYWLSLAADDRHPPALRQLATMYLSGKGVTLSLDAGIRYLEQASELGDKESIELLNKISSGDVEIQSNDPNTDTAAAEPPLPSSLTALGSRKELELLKKAANAGNAQAMLELGDYFRDLETQTGVDYALLWYQNAKTAQHSGAQDRLGELHLSKARSLLTEAVEHYLAAMGEGNRDARNWCEQNDLCCTSIKLAMAEWYLGIPDARRARPRAYKLLKSAYEDGSEKAKARLEELGQHIGISASLPKRT